MAAFGYGAVSDRAFVAFDQELDEGAWKEIATKKHEDAARESVVALLTAPKPVGWKVRLRLGIAEVLTALGAASLAVLDEGWDSAQRRLFHHVGAATDSDDRSVRAAADRLRGQILAGTGTAQTQYAYDDEVDFGRKQIALTQPGGPLAADAKKCKLEGALADVERTTAALAEGLGRGKNEKRRPPSKQLRDAMSECVAAFNAVHDELAWFVRKAPAGAERDKLQALLGPLDSLLERAAPAAAPVAETPSPAAPEPAPQDTPKPA